MLLAGIKDAVISFHILFIQTAFGEILLLWAQQYFISYNAQCSIPKLKIQWSRFLVVERLGAKWQLSEERNITKYSLKDLVFLTYTTEHVYIF